jgi:hypothetical protein
MYFYSWLAHFMTAFDKIRRRKPLFVTNKHRCSESHTLFAVLKGFPSESSTFLHKVCDILCTVPVSKGFVGHEFRENRCSIKPYFPLLGENRCSVKLYFPLLGENRCSVKLYFPLLGENRCSVKPYFPLLGENRCSVKPYFPLLRVRFSTCSFHTSVPILIKLGANELQLLQISTTLYYYFQWR